jgi:hypothetical protein
MSDRPEAGPALHRFFANGEDPSIVSSTAMLRPSPLDKATFCCVGGPWRWEGCTVWPPTPRAPAPP